MHHLMQGMFWGGLVMAIPPIILSVAVIMYVRKQQLREAELARKQAGDIP